MHRIPLERRQRAYSVHVRTSTRGLYSFAQPLSDVTCPVARAATESRRTSTVTMLVRGGTCTQRPRCAMSVSGRISWVICVYPLPVLTSLLEAEGGALYMRDPGLTVNLSLATVRRLPSRPMVVSSACRGGTNPCIPAICRWSQPTAPSSYPRLLTERRTDRTSASSSFPSFCFFYSQSFRFYNPRSLISSCSEACSHFCQTTVTLYQRIFRRIDFAHIHFAGPQSLYKSLHIYTQSSIYGDKTSNSKHS